MAAEKGLTLAQLAIGWLLSQGPDIVPIPGTRTTSRLEENAGAAIANLTKHDLATIELLLPRDAVAGDRRGSEPMANAGA